MSSREWRHRIDDILDAVRKVQDYTAGPSFEEFQRDHRTIDAVVRNFITIGEAASRIPPEIAQRHSSIPWRLMCDMRNFAVHE